MKVYLLHKLDGAIPSLVENREIIRTFQNYLLDHEILRLSWVEFGVLNKEIYKVGVTMEDSDQLERVWFVSYDLRTVTPLEEIDEESPVGRPWGGEAIDLSKVKYENLIKEE